VSGGGLKVKFVECTGPLGRMVRGWFVLAHSLSREAVMSKTTTPIRWNTERCLRTAILVAYLAKILFGIVRDAGILLRLGV
jgi:hypothetical protein